MKVKYLPINKENIKRKPDRFNIKIGEQEYIIQVSWNVEGFFSINIYDTHSNPIILGKKIVYGVDILSNVVDDRLPAGYKIIPMDKTGKSESTGITFDNFMDSVKPYIVGGS